MRLHTTEKKLDRGKETDTLIMGKGTKKYVKNITESYLIENIKCMLQSFIYAQTMGENIFFK